MAFFPRFPVVQAHRDSGQEDKYIDQPFCGHVVLAKIYAARETDTLGISSGDLQKKIIEQGTPCEYFETFDEIENYLLENISPGDLLITMGAGDIVKVGENLLGM